MTREPLLVDVSGAAPRSYPIHVDRGLLARLGSLATAGAPAHRYAVIADSRVARLYGAAAADSLAAAGARADLLTFPEGERHKSRATWAQLTDRMLAAGFGRDAAIVALGGGVTGDVAGFVASTYMRGIPLVAVPTSLLAMLDSSIGGKTGVDTESAKNAVGTFHHPSLVVIDPDLLGTLPARELRSGLAEAVKAAAILDAELFGWIETHAAELREGDPAALATLIASCLRIKAGVVADDPEEAGRRQILNFGHTAGHALEALAGFALPHGEAVAAGMRIEARLGEAAGVTEAGTAARLDAVLTACGIRDVLGASRGPAHGPAASGKSEDTFGGSVTASRLLSAAGSDKKARRGVPRWVLLRRIGEVAADQGGAAGADETGAWSRAVDPAKAARYLDDALRDCARVPEAT